MKSLARIKRYIIEEPWDAWLERQNKIIEEHIIWPFLAAVVVYFGTIAYIALRRMP
jgi:hypothetical protein